MSTSSTFKYEFILLPPVMNRKLRLPAGSVFTKTSVQRQLPQDCREKFSGAYVISCSAVRPTRRHLVIISITN
ncbi:hypothetical protein TNCV_3230381 [Trichonephila clavipes]|nr:hypothetical protein TNCV_3230381 [Trichonephila clavipes]